MAENELIGAIAGRLSRVRGIESQLVDRLEHLRTAGALEPDEHEAFTRQSALGAHHVLALDQVVGPGGTDLHRSEPMGGHRRNERVRTLVLEDAAAAAASAIVAYGALYASARLLYESQVCDLADAHAAEWARELPVLNDLLAPMVHRELVSEGLACRCVCPTCGIGACGCTRNSIDTIRGYWGQAELGPSDGLVLRLPPRPGSQLAEAGLERGDRIVAVDGKLVHTNAEIQRGLRGHAAGQSMAMEVVRAGEPQEIRVALVSDLPS